MKKIHNSEKGSGPVGAAQWFPVLAGREVEMELLSGGLVNRTWLCCREDGKRFVLQRLNPGVFPDPAALMKNYAAVCRHLEERCGRDAVPSPYPAADGAFFVADGRFFWRLLRHLPGRAAVPPLSLDEARLLGRTLGRFHTLLAGFDHRSLVPAIPGFHRLSSYLASYDRLAAGGDEDERVAALREEVARRRERALALEREWLAGSLTVQAVHGDPKAENFILFPPSPGAFAALIDLDTVMSGPLVLDVADCVRSCAVRGPDFDPAVARAVIEGWRGAAAGLLRPRDIEFIPLALESIVFELGLRFLTDHLMGDRYFRVSFPGENLHRAGELFSALDSVSL